MVRPADWSALKPSASSAASLVILFQLDLGLALFDSIRYTPENQHGTWNSRTIEKETVPEPNLQWLWVQKVHFPGF